MIISGFFSFAQGMELQLMGPYDKYDLEVHLNRSEEDLTRSYEAREMAWVPRMYEVSGLKGCMSRERFMVNALQKIRESMAATRCCPGLQDCVEGIKELPARDWESLFMGANLIGSFAALTTTLVMATNVKMPLPFPERLVSSSCVWAKLILNYTAGIEWANSCIVQSMQFDTPCNVTAAREAFNKNGGGVPQPSFCCYDIADSECHKVGLNYNKNIYPELHNQTLWDAWKPFMIACPAILAVQIGYVGGKKLRRYLRQNGRVPFTVAPSPLLLGDDATNVTEI